MLIFMYICSVLDCIFTCTLHTVYDVFNAVLCYVLYINHSDFDVVQGEFNSGA